MQPRKDHLQPHHSDSFCGDSFHLLGRTGTSLQISLFENEISSRWGPAIAARSSKPSRSKRRHTRMSSRSDLTTWH